MKNHITLVIGLFLFISCTSNKNKQNLPSIHIHHPEEFSWTEKKACKISYTTTSDNLVFSAKIKRRGGISSKYHKGSFTFKMEKNWPLAGLPSENDWVLNAAYVDKTFMRHKLAYDLYREMSPNNIASKVAFVELYINNKYTGLYQLTERIDSKRLHLDKTDKTAAYYKGPPLFRKDQLSYVQDSLNYYHQKFPKIERLDKTSELDSLRSFLFNSSDSNFVNEINQHFDLDNIIDWHLILLLSNNSDGILKNFYLYKQNKTTPHKIAIWDYDHSFGRDGDYEYNMMQRNIRMEINILFCRLMLLDVENYRARLKQRWSYLRENDIFSKKNIQNHIDSIDQQISGYIAKNQAIWPIDSKWYSDANNYKEEVEIIEQFIKIRLDYLDSYFKEFLQLEFSCDKP